ncbi:TPA: EVE domain-containing protein, partial [Candidatus Gracilibacteria bacterium]|nr:EVE domain-containing protein [Candidatus Gracilibacteria bacterium]
LKDIKENKKLENMVTLRKGNRLSITPLSSREFDEICKMSEIETIDSIKIKNKINK